MIGLMCSDGKRQAYVDVLHPIFAGLSATSKLPVGVFTMSDVDIEKRVLHGVSINSVTAREDTVPLPAVIYNLSVQSSKQSIRMLRALRQDEELELVNPTNRLRQQTVLEMLSTFKGLADHLFRYKLNDQQGMYTLLHQGQNLLVMPVKGTSLGNLMYLQAPSPYGRYDPREYEYLESQLLRTSIRQQWLVLQCPTLLLSGRRPVVIRVYLQKGLTNVWTVLAKRQLFAKPTDEEVDGSVTSIALQAISRLGSFLPALGLAFMDFVFDTEGQAYIVRAGGWDYRLLRAQELHWKLCINMLGHASALLTRQEVSTHVD